MSNSVNIDGDINFFYEDSGTDGLDSSDYTTMVLVHGMGFNGAVFRKLFPFGPSHNYRIVSLYRRGHAPSSPWTEEEVALLTSSDLEDGKKFIRLAGLQIAKFLLGFAASQGIPKYDKEKKTGGIVLNGWSLGTVYSQAVLSALDSLTIEELGQLETYLHAIIYHDPIMITFGIPRPPLAESSPHLQLATIAERWTSFKKFVTSFYVHRNPYSYDLADLNMYKPDEDRPASLSDLPEEELEQMLSFEMYASHDGLAFTVDLEVFRFANRRALFDVGMTRCLPNMKVRIVCGPDGSGVFIFLANEMERASKDPSSVFGKEAERAREFKVVRLERGNHFVFWDEPSWALDQFIACLDD
ncbi:hypothetical protein BKA82DRAFT_7225 [Pisolithus tinctorius]|uniref:AB hydrolase-1 domain-containing protein n=1 Tax=Pisolithus tinctorius Marx 270 TaxID=870435 RepID=A0A0C3PR70_PISTI|nr:hypothetical protein BKA82DRAFT_7225 [Pisolithus tinctorius]KIO11074.1 hypothetical protein M404DRAFT_7225 [Pisolithus tinctorius Marx 270]